MCLSLQSIVGVAGGATRAALTVHQARRDNMADISAKDGSQVLYWIYSALTQDLFLFCSAASVSHGAVNREKSYLHFVVQRSKSSVRSCLTEQEGNSSLSPYDGVQLAVSSSMIYKQQSVCVCVLFPTGDFSELGRAAD